MQLNSASHKSEVQSIPEITLYIHVENVENSSNFWNAQGMAPHKNKLEPSGEKVT